MKLKHALAVLVVALPFQVFAQATATKDDYCIGGDGNGACPQTVSTVTVQINVPPGDAGKPGAFFIGARATTGIPGNINNINFDTKGLWLFTPTGWKAFNGGLYEPIEYFSGLPAGRQYVVVNQQDLCQFIVDKNMELWAGYGVLQPDKEQAINVYFSVKAPRIPPEHLRAVYVYNDMKDARKYWNVLNMSACYYGGYQGGGN